MEKKPSILVVDDEELNRMLLFDELEELYEVEEAECGETALEMIYSNPDKYSAILLDLQMEGISGTEVLKKLKEDHLTDRIPVIIVTMVRDEKVEEDCLESGAMDFIHKPFQFTIIRARVANAVSLYQYKFFLEEKVREQTKELREKNELLEKKNCILQNQAMDLEMANQHILDMLGTAVECRDLESGKHIRRVRQYTEILAERLMQDYPEYKLNEEKVEMIVNASPLHDIGKLAIPDKILLKPGKFTADEFEVMKTHTLKGCELLDNIEVGWKDEYHDICYAICRHHHEKYDGYGYPDHLAGDNIPIAAQIVSVADVYDALVSKRIYKDAYGNDRAFQMILDGECGTFNPKILDCFTKVRNDFERVAETVC